MRRNPWMILGVVIIFFMMGAVFSVFSSCSMIHHEPVARIGGKQILVLDLEGVIIDGKKFLKQLRKYSKDNHVKGVLVRINSPGGVVGPSQEIYRELKRVREEQKKPVVVVSSSLMASGGYYAAVAADKIFANPGTIVGSIGVIMQFANLEKLYDWAKIQKIALTTGAYKDTGSDSRPMREDEKKYLQENLNEVLAQFKKAVSEGRKMPLEKLDPYADGRIFSGETAAKIGLIDEVGTFQDAVMSIGALTGLGKEPDLFYPPLEHKNVLDFVLARDDEDEESHWQGTLKNFLSIHGQPLYLMPGFFPVKAN